MGLAVVGAYVSVAQGANGVAKPWIGDAKSGQPVRRSVAALGALRRRSRPGKVECLAGQPDKSRRRLTFFRYVPPVVNRVPSFRITT